MVYVRLTFHGVESDGSSLGSCRNNYVQKFSSLLENGQITDCTLVSRDEKSFAVHRAVLAAQSPVFAAMFEHDMKEKSSGECVIQDVDGIVLEALIKFAYTCAPLELPAIHLPDLHDAADKYDMDDLRRHCEIVMIGAIAVDNGLRYLNFATERGLPKLKKQAIKFLYQHSDEL
ncbi:speckle-type POZ protein B-like [Paramacrobiotus metropolitanus]|uniref:speckle-type POZ protein B-like n=1 Tax=Paramacrobiotus metropolitanus TaxID=2943436 RepID=UPI00244563BA|nr:speckle-type POZ protein B-like [Paramacrobiotus metropolitanus]